MAEEIRKLADTTNGIVSKITSNMDIVTETNQIALEQMNFNLQTVTKQVDDADQVNHAFKDITDYFQVLRNQFDQFRSLATEAEQNAMEIGMSTNDLSAVMEQASAGLQEMSATVTNIQEDNEDIRQSMEQTEAIAKKLGT